MTREKLTPCEKCPLKPALDAGFFVSGEGDLERAKVMILGEAPGYDECHAEKKVPFIGRAGHILRKIVGDVLARLSGLDLSSCSVAATTISPVYITNAVKCWPGEGNPDPPAEAIVQCREAFLEGEVARFGGKKIVMLGAVAVHSVLRRKRKLSELIGMPLEYAGKLAMATFHPAYYLYSHSKQVLTDIERAIEWGLRDDLE